MVFKLNIISNDSRTLFENDVKMYGIQTPKPQRYSGKEV
mgnify:CR=1 FL=1